MLPKRSSLPSTPKRVGRDTPARSPAKPKLVRRKSNVNYEARELEQVYNDLLGELGDSRVGAAVSLKERRDLQLTDDANLRYAECGFLAVYESIRKIRLAFGRPGEGHSGGGVLQRAGGVFVDLGAGMGKACIAAVLSHAFARAVGVECLEGLYELSLELQKEYEARARKLLFPGDPDEPEEGAEASPLEAAAVLPKRPMPKVSFRREDMRGYDVSDADVVLLHAASLEAETVAAVLPRLAGMRPGRFVVTITAQLPEGSGFDVVDTSILACDGSDCLVFIHQKQAETVHEAEAPSSP
ncbi:hypothetical protein M885DRAFT_531270 [Pelagophyceae sp. CCMP2097]|nr:hypothetical protein M885DRAFT_531270 [Pelagophyceae sp. CCMP2097]|mmetsp:Transcript_6859/g.22227  ORF Transcript_6859/g.22227 Transcript_6859/m.22227 type:complete len:298 (-) Transcript_6859:67-960(-)